MNQHRFTDIHITKHPDTSEVEIQAELSAENFGKYRGHALKNLGKSFALPGFRKGHIPVHIIEDRVGNEAILREMADIVLSKELPMLLISEGILPLNTPAVTLSPLSLDKPLSLTVRIEVMPEFDLPDYITIAQSHPFTSSHPEVSENEFTDAIQHIAREQARIKKVESGTAPAQAAEESSQIPSEELPDLEEEFATSLGYESLDQFKEKLRHNLSHEKARREHEKRRTAILDTLVSKTSVHIPSSLVSHELDKMEAQMSEDLHQAGISFEQYLTHLQKTRESLRQDWTPVAVKRATIQLILSKVAQRENIDADQNSVNELTEHTLKQHSGVSRDNVRAYYTQQLRNEAVLRFLEGGNSPESEPQK